MDFLSLPFISKTPTATEKEIVTEVVGLESFLLKNLLTSLQFMKLSAENRLNVTISVKVQFL